MLCFDGMQLDNDPPLRLIPTHFSQLELLLGTCEKVELQIRISWWCRRHLKNIAQKTEALFEGHVDPYLLTHQSWECIYEQVTIHRLILPSLKEIEWVWRPSQMRNRHGQNRSESAEPAFFENSHPSTWPEAPTSMKPIHVASTNQANEWNSSTFIQTRLALLTFGSIIFGRWWMTCHGLR